MDGFYLLGLGTLQTVILGEKILADLNSLMDIKVILRVIIVTELVLLVLDIIDVIVFLLSDNRNINLERNFFFFFEYLFLPGYQHQRYQSRPRPPSRVESSDN